MTRKAVAHVMTVTISLPDEYIDNDVPYIGEMTRRDTQDTKIIRVILVNKNSQYLRLAKIRG